MERPSLPARRVPPRCPVAGGRERARSTSSLCLDLTEVRVAATSNAKVEAPDRHRIRRPHRNRLPITTENLCVTADAIRVEQTIEFLYCTEWIQQDVVGQVLNDDGSDITIGYDSGVASGGLVQVLNLLWGNVSLFPGSGPWPRLPDSILDEFRGPRFGIRDFILFALPIAPSVCTAVKPMGSSPRRWRPWLEPRNRRIRHHQRRSGLADQPWATWRDRVHHRPGGNQAASETGHPSAYMPSLNVPVTLREAPLRRAGAGRCWSCPASLVSTRCALLPMMTTWLSPSWLTPRSLDPMW